MINLVISLEESNELVQQVHLRKRFRSHFVAPEIEVVGVYVLQLKTRENLLFSRLHFLGKYIDRIISTDVVVRVVDVESHGKRAAVGILTVAQDGRVIVVIGAGNGVVERQEDELRRLGRRQTARDVRTHAVAVRQFAVGPDNENSLSNWQIGQLSNDQMIK